MNELKDRINKVISTAGIKKTDFAKKLKVSQAFISQLCAGTSQPSDRTIADICREFGVNELWLRTGEGEMFRAKTRETEISEYFERVLSDTDEFQRRFISVLSRLSADEWRLIESMAQKLAEETTKNPEDN